MTTFSNFYLLDPSTFAITSADESGALTFNIADDILDGGSDNPLVLGDVSNDRFTGVLSDGSANYFGTYVAQGSASGSIGIIINWGGQLAYLTNNNTPLGTVITPNYTSTPLLNPDPEASFAYFYKCSGSDPTSLTVDTVTGSLTGANTFNIVDNIQNTPNDDPAVLGDVSNDQFTAVYSDGTNWGEGVYVGQAQNLANGASGTIISWGHGYYFCTNTALATGSDGALTNFTSAPECICFMPGTMIRTAGGEMAVETLKRGDLVTTADGRTMPVTWLGRQTISRLFADPLRVLPIRIKAGALADNTPSRDLLISPDHAVLFDGALIQAGALVNGTSIVRETNVPTIFTYYHVELDDHSLILAENTPAETFVDNVDRLNFDNWAEHQALYPEGKSVEELPYPRAKSQRQVPVAIRVKLGERAQAIGAAVGVVAA